jgi:intracellular sulfur oxidation DsrE/DsrF family protein
MNAWRLERLTAAGVAVLADDLSLRERGIKPDELAPGVQDAGIETLVDAIVRENTKALWH